MPVAVLHDGKADSRTGDTESQPAEEVAAMGGPWRERGFDAASLRSPRPHSGPRAQALAREREQDRLGKVVLVYIAAVAVSCGLMLSLLQQRW
jgi:hypothetical protein